MADEAKKRFKYSIHLAAAGVKEVEGFLTEKARKNSKTIPLRGKLPFECELRYISAPAVPPSWASKLNELFAVDGKIKTASASAAIIFRCKDRIFASCYGLGHTMLDADKRENDFGLLVAANSLSDENVKLVEKANLGSVIRDATQAAGITNLQEFNVDRALSLVRRLSGKSKDSDATLSGASSFTMTTSKDVDELHEIAKILLKLYKDKSYTKTSFAIIDKIKPVFDIKLVDTLDKMLVENVNSEKPSFELGAPEISTEPVGFMTLPGSGARVQLPDVTLSTYLSVIGKFESLQVLFDYKIATWNIDGKYQLKIWSVYRGLVGSIKHDGARYALNEGKWYRIDDALAASANATFLSVSKGLDASFLAWPIVVGGKKKKTPVYEREDEFNERIVASNPARFCLFDKRLIAIPNAPGPGFEACDILDLHEKRLIHVKRSGRRSSIISHFLMQGMNSAKLLKQYDAVRQKFTALLSSDIGEDEAKAAMADFPSGWTVEYKFGDEPMAGGSDYTIPFFSRVTLDEVKREVEAHGFKAVEVSFIRLSKAPKK